MMREVHSVVISKPDGTAGFTVGAKLVRGEEETLITVKSIRVSILRKVSIFLSDGNTIVFNGYPISYEVK